PPCIHFRGTLRPRARFYLIPRRGIRLRTHRHDLVQYRHALSGAHSCHLDFVVIYSFVADQMIRAYPRWIKRWLHPQILRARAFQSDTDEPMRTFPRTSGDIDTDREWFVRFRLGIIVSEIIDHLFDAHRAFKGPRTIVDELSD